MIALEEHTIISAPVERCFDLARSVEVHLAGNMHWGEAAVASLQRDLWTDRARPKRDVASPAFRDSAAFD